jgi:putative addiction module killer protein
MLTIKQLPEFTKWLNSIKDGMTRRRLARRLEKAQGGNLGDIKTIGEGVTEMREHFGAGWRMYFVQRGDVLIVMLGGGTKSTQEADIAKSIELSKTIEG